MSHFSLSFGPWTPCTEKGMYRSAVLAVDVLEKLLECPEEPQAKGLLEGLLASVGQEKVGDMPLRFHLMGQILKGILSNKPGTKEGVLAYHCLTHIKTQGWRIDTETISNENVLTMLSAYHAYNLNEQDFKKDLLPQALLCLQEMGFDWSARRKSEASVIYLLDRSTYGATRFLHAFSEAALLPAAHGMRPETIVKHLASMLYKKCNEDINVHDPEACKLFTHHALQYIAQSGGVDLLSKVKDALSARSFKNDRQSFANTMIHALEEESLQLSLDAAPATRSRRLRL